MTMKNIAATMLALPMMVSLVHAAPTVSAEPADHVPGVAAPSHDQAAVPVGGCAHCATHDCANCPLHVAMRNGEAVVDTDSCAD